MLEMEPIRDHLRSRLEKYREARLWRRNSTGLVLPASPTKTHQPPSTIPHTVSDPTPQGETNSLMYQAFEWYSPSDPHSGNRFWKQLASSLPSLRKSGVSMLWLPPGCKAGNPQGNGYDIYDLWDLGEFDWKGQRPTKWGCREELEELCRQAKVEGVGVVWDAVLSHRAFADFSEQIKGVKVSDKDRRRVLGKPRDITAWTGFDFPARGDTYSSLKLRHEHFNATDWDDRGRERAIFNLCDEEGVPKGWAKDVDPEFGNYDYLMFTNLSYGSSALRADVLNWGVWIIRTLGLSGMRIDALKHISLSFALEFMTHIQQEFGRDFFFVGEYWKWDSEFLNNIVTRMDGRCRLYDVQLCYNFSDYSTGKKKDLRRVLEGSLTQLDAQHAVTFVMNHDTQPTQLLAIPFEPWFLPHAYSLILLRACASLPCVFHGHLHGTSGPEAQPPLQCLPRLMFVRKHYAYGTQHNYWDDPECIGWTRIGKEGSGDDEGCVVLLSSSKTVRSKKMFAGEKHKGAIFQDVINGGDSRAVMVGQDGWAVFQVNPRRVGVWVRIEEVKRHTLL